MAETTGENFGLKGISQPVRPEAALELGGSRVVNGERLGEAWLRGQDAMVEPIANLLTKLVSSGGLKKEDLEKALSEAHRPMTWAHPLEESAEAQAVQNVSSRFLVLLAVRIAGGNAEEASSMLGLYGNERLGSDPFILADFVKTQAAHPLK